MKIFGSKMKKKLIIIAILLFTIFQKMTAQGWQWVDSGYPYLIFDMSFPSGQSNIGFAVGSNLTFGGDGIILKTTDGGLSWEKISVDTIPGLKAVCFASVDAGYVCGFQNFLVKTTDGGSTWIPIVINPKLWYFNNVEFWDANNGVVVSYPSAIYFTTDAGATWNEGLGIKHSIEDVCYADANTLYMASGDEEIYKSTNGGFTWTEVYSGIPQTFFLGVDFYDLNYGMVCGEYGKVLVTTDGGINWIESNTGGSGLMQGLHIFDMEKAYVVGTTEQVYKTTDCGITWISDFNGIDTVAFYKIKFTENNTGIICGSQGKFLINTDYVVPVELSGFTASAHGTDVELNWVTKTELNNSGFEIQRLNQETSWEKIAFVRGNGTSSEPVEYSFIDKELKGGNYFYRLKQIDFDGNFEYSDKVNVFISYPIDYSLDQNYPNPFNPNTTIKFGIKEETQVNLTIFNILGEKVRELKNEVMKSGYYEVEFDGSTLVSGVYIYKIQAGIFVESKKMILMK
jgi:photosystem II stability/assembly factor-like uncharacterized protein